MRHIIQLPNDTDLFLCDDRDGHVLPGHRGLLVQRSPPPPRRGPAARLPPADDLGPVSVLGRLARGLVVVRLSDEALIIVPRC